MLVFPKPVLDTGIISAGSGIKLPLETEDDEMLLDDDRIAFSHRYNSSGLMNSDVTQHGIVPSDDSRFNEVPVAVDVK